MAYAVEFLGWLTVAQLVSALSGVDILVNPSLRAWSETFCIVNLEALAMRVSLVTFAVGGVGEYVAQPAHTDTDNESASQCHWNTNMNSAASSQCGKPFSVTDNAVVVNIASPHALALAVEALISNATLRLELGERGRRTVEKYFTVERQMNQYRELYTEMMSPLPVTASGGGNRIKFKTDNAAKYYSLR